ncbi:MAG: hypothetical protein HXX13_13040 [Bacteroidetes bacterium]|nr:hypothetical protein [Bacteroidota bacterium]
MKSKISLLTIAVIISIAFSSCKKDNQDQSSSGPSALNLKMEALNTTVSLPVQENGLKSATSNATISWDSAYMLVSRIKFEAEIESQVHHRDSVEIEYSWRGPLMLNLLDPSSVIGTITLPEGTYDKISLKVMSEREDANGQPLFFLSGNYNDSLGVVTPIVVSVTDPIAFKTDQTDDTIATGTSIDYTSTIQLYLDQLFLNIDPATLSSATLTNGVLVISATSNKKIYHFILHNLGHNHKCHHEHHHH